MSGGANLLTAVLVGVQLAAFERPAALTIPRGTDVPVTLDENVTLKRDQVGSIFPAHITRDILVAGVVANRAGAPAQVVLVEGDDTPGAASFHPLSVSIRGDMRPIRTDVARADAVGSRSNVGKKAGIGAIAGGAVGLLLGGGGGLLAAGERAVARSGREPPGLQRPLLPGQQVPTPDVTWRSSE